MSDEPSDEPLVIDAIEKRHNPWLLGLAASPLALIPVLLVVALLTKPFVAAFSFHLLFIGLFALAYVATKKPFAKRVPVEVRADAESITVGERRIAREDIERGDLTGGGSTVTLRRTRRRETELNLQDEAQARALLQALGLDVSQTTASFRAMSRSQATILRGFLTAVGVMIPTVVISGLLGALAPPLAGAGMLLGMLAMFVLMLAPSTIEVGADGVLSRWLGRERFLSHAEIESAFSNVEGFGRSKRAMVVLVLRSGEHFRVPVGTPIWGGEAKADALAARIQAARGEFERGSDTPEALLRPADASYAVWVSKLRAGDVVGLRQAVVPRHRLWRVVEDAAGDPLERAAATVALGRTLEPGERDRLARVAKRTAAPKLRVVLESAADADEAELAEQLEEVEVEAARAKRA